MKYNDILEGLLLSRTYKSNDTYYRYRFRGLEECSNLEAGVHWEPCTTTLEDLMSAEYEVVLCKWVKPGSFKELFNCVELKLKGSKVTRSGGVLYDCNDKKVLFNTDSIDLNNWEIKKHI